MKQQLPIERLNQMSKKDYIAIAAEFKNQLALAKHGDSGLIVYATLQAIADRLAIQFGAKPSFDRAKFMNACGF